MLSLSGVFLRCFSIAAASSVSCSELLSGMAFRWPLHPGTEELSVVVRGRHVPATPGGTGVTHAGDLSPAPSMIQRDRSFFNAGRPMISEGAGVRVCRRCHHLARTIHECRREAFETEARRGFSPVRPTQAYLQSVEETEREKPRRARGSDAGAGIHE